MLKPGNVHSADGWCKTLAPVVTRYEGRMPFRSFRMDMIFTRSEVYDFLEREESRYAIRLPASERLQEAISYLLTRPVGRSLL